MTTQFKYGASAKQFFRTLSCALVLLATMMSFAHAGSYNGADMTIMSCFEKDGMPMPPEYSPSADRWTRIPKNADEKYKPWIACYSFCLSLAPQVSPVSRGTKATADAVCAIDTMRYQQVANGAQAACMRNLMKRSRAESGPMAANQKKKCEDGRDSNSFGKDPQTGAEYSCDKGMSELEERVARANCMSGEKCMQNKVSKMKNEERTDFEDGLASQIIDLEGEKWQAMNNILDGMAAMAAAVPPSCSNEGAQRVK